MRFPLHVPTLLLSSIVLLLLPLPTFQKVIEYDMDVRQEYGSPDGVLREIVRVNDEFQTFEVRCSVGDTLKVTVHNHLHVTPVSVHWHGFEMMGDQWHDGTSYITQCPIGPTPFVYYFKCQDSPGTYWWHGHNSELRADGFQGPLIIEDPPAVRKLYDEEITVMMTDWYHSSAHYIVTGLDGPSPPNTKTGYGFTWPGDPMSFLFNGKGKFDCAVLAPSEGTALCNSTYASSEIFRVQAGKTYLLRLIGGFTLSYTNFAVEEHRLTVIRTDGQLVKPFTVDSLDINSGERYDVLLKADQDPGKYWMQVETRYRNLVMGRAMVIYEGVENDGSMGPFTNPLPLPGQQWDPTWLKSPKRMPKKLRKLLPDKSFVLTGAQELVEEENGMTYIKWPVNGNVYAPPECGTPLLELARQDRLDLAPKANIFEASTGDVVDFVFQNRPSLSGVIEQHPWHLHGYHFYVLGWGPGEFDYETHAELLNLKNPPLKDTVTVYPSNDESIIWDGSLATAPDRLQPDRLDEPFGWVVVRFEADNPGAWLLHCHIGWHMGMGMMATFVEDKGHVPPSPSWFPECGVMDALTEGTNVEEFKYPYGP